MANATADCSLLGKIAGYIEILHKDPRSTVFVPLAEAYRQMGLLDDALDVAAKGVRALPMFCPGHTILGRVQAQRGALDAAAAAFEKALLIERDNLNALKGLARVRAQQGKKDHSLELLRRALAIKPDDPSVRQMLTALQRLPAVAVVEAPCAPAPAAVPPAPEPEPIAAVPAAAAAHAPAEDPISTATIAEIYVRQGFLQRALKVYRDLLEADPHNEMIRQKLVALKRQIEAQQAPAAGGEPPAPSAASAATEAVVPASTEVAPAAAALAIFNRWLDSIHSRRADVR